MADQIKAALREFGEVIAYAIAAYKKGIAADKIFTASPTDSNGYLASFIRDAIERHVAGPDAVEAVRALPSICWWHPDGYPVFNNMNGADLILRDEAIAAVRVSPAAAPAVPAVDALTDEQCYEIEKCATSRAGNWANAQGNSPSDEQYSGKFVRAILAGAHALATPSTAPDEQKRRVPQIEYTPGQWFDARTLDEMQAFYLSRLPAIREAAKEHGYAIGLHGSERRDFDLMAMQWRDGASGKDELAHAVAVAACGLTRDGAYQWEKKSNGRFAVSLPICWTDHANPDFDKPSMGHIDLSVIDSANFLAHPADAGAVAVEQAIPGAVRQFLMDLAGLKTREAASMDLQHVAEHLRTKASQLLAASQPRATPLEATSDEPTAREQLIACLGDDAAKLEAENPGDEMAQTMREAAVMLEADEQMGGAQVASDDLDLQTISERDYNADIADKLADGVAAHFGQDIGEHSSANCPWLNALEILNTKPEFAPCTGSVGCNRVRCQLGNKCVAAAEGEATSERKPLTDAQLASIRGAAAVLDGFNYSVTAQELRDIVITVTLKGTP